MSDTPISDKCDAEWTQWLQDTWSGRKDAAVDKPPKTPIECAQDLERELSALRQAREWIPVAERLPDDDCRCLVANWMTMHGIRHVDIESFRRGTGLFETPDVTHWQPLPAAPEQKP